MKRKVREHLEKNAATGRNGYVPRWQWQLTNFHSLCKHVTCSKNSEDKYFNQPLFLLPIACPLWPKPTGNSTTGWRNHCYGKKCHCTWHGRKGRSRGQVEDSQPRTPRQMKDSSCFWTCGQHFLKIYFLILLVWAFYLSVYTCTVCVPSSHEG